MITGSFRTENCLEIWDLRMWGRSKVIPWEGSGAFEVNDNETDDENLDEAQQVRQSEDDDAMSIHSRQKSEAGSTTTA